MDATRERQVNEAAYRRLADSIKQTYPAGRFLAIAGGQVVADAGHFEELRPALQALIVQAGVEYPETAVIFATEEHP